MIGETFSHYTITKKLGEGGMGAVFLAEDTELRRNVALKFLPEYYTSKPDIKTRFKREAQAAAALNHPAIITVYEVGEYRDSSYIAMEYVEGKSLRDLIDAGEISFERALELIVQIADGLSFAHQHGIVHRDIKPENIMIDKYGRVKILDFGLAKYKGVTRITREGTTMGTVHYMSPEQVKGREVDHRADIYSLGVVLYELLSGELPFSGQYEAAILYAIVNEEPTPISKHLPAISPSLEKIIRKMICKDVKSRYQRLEDFLADMKKERQASTKTYKPTVLLENYQQPKVKEKKSPVLVAALSSVAVLALAFTLIFSGVFQSGGSPKQTPEQPQRLMEQPKEGPPKENVSAKNLVKEPPPKEVPPKEPPRIEKTAGQVETKITQVPRSTPIVAPDAPKTGLATDRQAGGLQITSNPAGASVLLNGRSVGKTPFTDKNLNPESYDLLLKMDGYHDYFQRVRITAGQTASVNAALKIKEPAIADQPETKPEDKPTPPAIGAIKILVKPYGSIYVNGKLIKSDWQFQHREELPAGKHTIRAVHRTFGTWEKEITIAAGKTDELVVDFTKQVKVTVASTPWGDIYVDNQPTGFQTPKEITLNVGKHVIEVRREGFEPVDGPRVINFENNLAQPLRFELKKK
jgi:serine/threonine protein kinase